MLAEILEELKEHQVTLVAVSKKKPNETILQMCQAGHRIFGENRVQELVEKYETLPKDIEWHFIGHLQTNKVKYIAPFVSLIHGVDSLKILKAINKEARKNSRVIDCLLQMHIAQESTKFGLDEQEAIELLQSDAFASLKNVRITGLMGMATYTEDESRVRQEFRGLKRFFDQLKYDFFADEPYFKTLSMGMSGDYKIAIEEGSTMVRIGSLLFGPR